MTKPSSSPTDLCLQVGYRSHRESPFDPFFWSQEPVERRHQCLRPGGEAAMARWSWGMRPGYPSPFGETQQLWNASRGSSPRLHLVGHLALGRPLWRRKSGLQAVESVCTANQNTNKNPAGQPAPDMPVEPQSGPQHPESAVTSESRGMSPMLFDDATNEPT
jgi:hypothetical protein